MKQTSLHSLLSAISLAVLTWVGYETVQNGKAIASLANAMTHVERKLDDTVPRREHEARVTQLETEVRTLVVRVRDLELNTKVNRHP